MYFSTAIVLCVVRFFNMIFEEFVRFSNMIFERFVRFSNIEKICVTPESSQESSCEIIKNVQPAGAAARVCHIVIMQASS